VTPKKMRLLVSAGAWGYGPVTTVHMFLDQLSRIAQIDFVGTSIAFDYARTHSMLYRRVMSSLDEIDTKYDLVLSVVEPTILLWARERGVPSISFDNLFWHWNWTDSVLENVRDRLDSENTSDREATLTALADLGEYAEYSLMYVLSEVVICQRVASVPVGLPEAMTSRMCFVDPLLRRITPEAKQRQLLLSLSGGLVNPMATERHWDVYVELIARILLSALEEAKVYHFKVKVAAPDELNGRLRSRLHTEDVQAYDHGSFLKEVSRSRLVIAPKGLSTTFEAAYYGAVLFSLPEQHDGNLYNYHGVAELSGLDYDEFKAVFPDAQIGNFHEDLSLCSTEELFQAYEHELACSHSSYVEDSVKRLTSIIRASSDDELFTRAAARQIGAIRAFGGDLDGIEQSMRLIEGVISMRNE
jgi:hypothetical protein